MPPSGPPPLVLETLQKVGKLRQAVQADDHDLVLAHAKSLLDNNAHTMREKLHQTVALLYLEALLQQPQQLERIPDLLNKYLSDDDHRTTGLWKAYVWYRLAKYDQALAWLLDHDNDEDDDENKIPQHLRAQCLYRQGRIHEAALLYQALCKAHPTDAHLATNYVATQVADATPSPQPQHDSNDDDNDDDDALLQNLLNDNKTNNNNDDSNLPFDLLYNLATRHALTGQGPAIAWDKVLRHANDPQQIAPIQMNQAWARAMQQGGAVDVKNTTPLKELPALAKVVALVNQALGMDDNNSTMALKLLPATAHGFTPLQMRLLTYNRAVLQYKARQWDACVETCRSHSKLVSPLSKPAKHWWDSRLLVLQARAHIAKGGKQATKATEPLHALVTTLQKQSSSSSSSSSLRDNALLYVQCHLADMEQPDLRSNATQRLALLNSLPCPSAPAVVASQAALYQELGQTEQAQALVRDNPQVLADLWLAQGDYTQAVALYETADLTDPVNQARYARALTYTDPVRAASYWASVRDATVLEQAVGSVDGAALEKQPLPRYHRTTRRLVVDATVATDPAKAPKSHEAVLRRRARQREAHLAALDRRGLKHTTHPDPERWLPKYERSYNRRRRGGKGGVHHKGAQGGVSDKDAARLDVAARQAARAAGEPAASTSTAHIAAVSSGGPSRKGGRRR